MHRFMFVFAYGALSVYIFTKIILKILAKVGTFQ